MNMRNLHLKFTTYTSTTGIVFSLHDYISFFFFSFIDNHMYEESKAVGKEIG